MALLLAACQGEATPSVEAGAPAAGADGGAGATIDGPPIAPPAGCVTDTFCADQAGVTPCPSGYDCNEALMPPRCVRLYCTTERGPCSEDVQCTQGLICDHQKRCAPPTLVGEGETCNDPKVRCSQAPAPLECVDGVCLEVGRGRFLGTWRYLEGTRLINCPAIGTQTSEKLDGMAVTVGKGTDAPLVLAVGKCSLRMDLRANIATLRANQTCPTETHMMQGVPFTEIPTFSSGTFAINGATAIVTFIGSSRFQGSSVGVMADCTFTASGTLMKESR